MRAVDSRDSFLEVRRIASFEVVILPYWSILPATGRLPETSYAGCQRLEVPWHRKELRNLRLICSIAIAKGFAQ